jgi:hypothetical protein
MLFRQLLTDYQMLATAGGDFAKRNPTNGRPERLVDRARQVRPAVRQLRRDRGARHHAGRLRDDLPAARGAAVAKVKDSNKALTVAHKCIIEGAKGDIHIPAKDDEFDTEGPAPASRLALYQMLARFEKFDVDTAEDEAVEDAEAALKALKNKK